MGKKKQETPELTLESFHRAIRTYQRDQVLYLMQHGILRDVPEEEKIPTYRQLVSLQSMEIMQALAKYEPALDPEIFCKQSDSSQSKVFVNTCLLKFKKQFQTSEPSVCHTLFTLSCQCGCVGMLHLLIGEKKVPERYPELGGYSLDILKTIREIPAGTLSDSALVDLYFTAATTADAESKLDYLAANGFDLFVKNADGRTVIDQLNARVKEHSYAKNRHGNLMQLQDKKMAARLSKMLYEQTHPPVKEAPSKKVLGCGIAVACATILAIAICVASASRNAKAADESTTEAAAASDSTQSSAAETSYSTDSSLSIKDGDTVNIDYVGSIDGTTFDGGSTNGQGTDLTIGSGSYIDDFEEQLIGTHPGDEVQVNVTFPDDYGNDELNGKDATFAVTVNGIYK